jgi:hypothetical protein
MLRGRFGDDGQENADFGSIVQLRGDALAHIGFGAG